MLKMSSKVQNQMKQQRNEKQLPNVSLFVYIFSVCACRKLFEALVAMDHLLRDACWVWHVMVWSCWTQPCDPTSGGHLRTMTMDWEPSKVGKPGPGVQEKSGMSRG